MTLISTLSQLKSRSIHLTTHPPPRSVIETRAVLGALQRFGEVVTFRNLKYDPTCTGSQKDVTTIAIFDSDDAAQAAIKASPLQVPITKRSSNPTDPHHSHSHPHHPDSNNYHSSFLSDSHPHQDPTPTPQQNQFTLNIFIKPARHNHEAAVRRNPFHTAFSKPDPESAIHKDLVQTGIELRALADVPTAQKEALPDVQRKKIHGWLMKAGAGSLMGLWRNGTGTGYTTGLGAETKAGDGDGDTERRKEGGDREGIKDRDG
ncbi:hypothetical protein BJY01DRAFT_217554 [Aspergillus pseudoustus]|uniref:RRM domain-containing protein n=1 Tax=Aspergillus pseudoustus TaxID=1810923 RepID=A0ABR4JQW8_9EURO